MGVFRFLDPADLFSVLALRVDVTCKMAVTRAGPGPQGCYGLVLCGEISRGPGLVKRAVSELKRGEMAGRSWV